MAVIASIILKIEDAPTRLAMSKHFADSLAKGTPDFNRERFLEAATIDMHGLRKSIENI